MIRLEGVSVLPAVKPLEIRRRALDSVAWGDPVARVASSVDNALIERFWSTMQREPLNRQQRGSP
jgi:hypothetical protein